MPQIYKWKIFLDPFPIFLLQGPKGDRGMLSSVTGDLPTAILEGPPGPPGATGKYNLGALMF